LKSGQVHFYKIFTNKAEKQENCLRLSINSY